MSRVIKQSNHTELNHLIPNIGLVYTRLVDVLSKRESRYFAQPKVLASATQWVADDGVVSYDALSDDEKAIFDVNLMEAKTEVEDKLKGNPEFIGTLKDLFRVPNASFIFCKRVDAEFIPLLTGWGCESTHVEANPNPVEHIISKAADNLQDVTVSVHYTNDEIVTPFEYKYKTYVSRFVPDAEGKKKLGKLKVGTEFSISEDFKADRTISDIIVERGKELYTVRIPIFTDVSIVVKNQLGETLPDYPLRVRFNDDEYSVTSDASGKTSLDNILLDNLTMSIVSGIDETIVRSYLINTKSPKLEFNIDQKIDRPLKVSVVNEDDEPMTQYPLSIVSAGETHSFETGPDGIVDTGSYPLDSEVKIIDGRDEFNHGKCLIQNQENEYTLRVKEPEKQFVTIQVLGYDKKPLENGRVELRLAKGSHKATLDDQGKVSYPIENFTHQEKFLVDIYPEDNTKVKTKKVRFTNENLLYVLQLKKPFKWWLWLLLLLFLLLFFIPFKKEMVVQTVLDGQPVPNVEVSSKLNNRLLYDDMKFWVINYYDTSGVTDERGVMRLKTAKWSLFSFFFKFNTPLTVTSNNECMSSGTYSKRFHLLRSNDTIHLQLKRIEVPLSFKIIDKETGTPINKARLYSTAGKDTLYSNIDGIVTLPGVALCDTIRGVWAAADGYSGDSLLNITRDIITGDISGRTLKLTPLKDNIQFTVIDCITKEPIPEANVRITIRDKNTQKSQDVVTNVDGTGKGSVEDINVKSEIELVANKSYYKEGRFQKQITVEDFNKLPDSLRVICLEPLPNPIQFQTIDSLTGRPVEGVSNVVTIMRAGKSTTQTIVSNSNGVFTVADLLRTDKISIVSDKKPGYNTNQKTIKNRDVAPLMDGSPDERAIPLSPVMVDLTFRTIDEYDKSILPEVKLKILIDNKHASKNSSGRGAFTIKAPITAKITIIADKDGYKTNDYTIIEKSAEYLSKAFSNERDIPMGLPNCTGGGEVSTNILRENIKEVVLGENPNNCFTFIYDTDDEPDHIKIFCGRKKDIAGKAPIFEINEATGHGISKTAVVRANCRFITITTTDAKTYFEYQIKCDCN